MADPSSHNPQSLFDPLEVPAALTLLYTSPNVGGERGTRISSITVVNRTTTAVAFRLTHTESGGAAGVTKAVAWDMNIPGDGVPHEFLVGAILNPGDFLSHEAGVVNRLVIHGFGWEMTD